MRLLPYLNALYHRRLLQTEVMRPLQPCYRAAAAPSQPYLGRVYSEEGTFEVQRNSATAIPFCLSSAAQSRCRVAWLR
jgi:hypothetical protein